jgi:hypothetical protein
MFAVGAYNTLKICDRLGVRRVFSHLFHLAYMASGHMPFQNPIADLYLTFHGRLMGLKLLVLVVPDLSSLGTLQIVDMNGRIST